MSSDSLQSMLTTIQQTDCVSIALISAVGYDYVLTFSEEIEYVWSKPWTWVSTLFIPVRYLGLFNLVVSALLGSSLLPGDAKTYVVLLPSLSDFLIQLISIKQFIVNAWTFLLFFAAADFLMILRVWAMYSRSKLILGTLLTLYFAVIIGTVLAVAVDSVPKNLPTEITQVLDFSVCSLGIVEPTWTNVAVVLQITQGGVMCLLAVIQVTRQSLQMYHATETWQLNRYMALLVRQGILSFLAILLFNLVNVLSVFGKAPTGGWQLQLLVVLEYVPIYTLAPRFVLSMREMYAADVRGRYGGKVDTAFGLSMSGTTMVFASARQNERSADVEETQMETLDN